MIFVLLARLCLQSETRSKHVWAPALKVPSNPLTLTAYPKPLPLPQAKHLIKEKFEHNLTQDSMLLLAIKTSTAK